MRRRKRRGRRRLRQLQEGNAAADVSSEARQGRCLRPVHVQQVREQGIACYGAADSNEIKLCKDMVDCGRSSGCGNPGCYCGSSDLFLCLAGIANGPCKNQVAAAAKTNSLLDIQSRSTDTKFPLGRANALGDCVDMNCAADCGR